MTKETKTNLRNRDQAFIFKIDRYATHDGPGIRTTIFFKGCLMNCTWCSNPESQKTTAELGFLKMKCVGCGTCINSCHADALSLKDEKATINRELCDNCFDCVPVCPSNALQIYGYEATLPELMDILNRDRHIYRRSGGGVTLTGGEPTLQYSFVKKLLEECRRVGIHTTLETCGFSSPEDFKQLLPYVNWLYFDLKHCDPDHHRKVTGNSNKIILQNLTFASHYMQEHGKPLVVRQVVVPGINDTQWIGRMVELISQLPYVTAMEFLPYHNYGMDKYAAIGKVYDLTDVRPPAESDLKTYVEMAEARGLKCTIGGL